MPTVTKRDLQRTHEDFDPELWAQYLALYEGGSALANSPYLSKLFPMHVGEHEKTYAKRRERMLYINYAAYILNQHVVALFDDELTVEATPSGGGDFFDDWLADASAPGGNRTPWCDMLQQQLINALVCRLAWTRVSLPDPAAGEGASRLDQEKSGDLQAFATPFEASMVPRWHATQDGRVEWLLVHSVDDGGDQFVPTADPVLQWELWTADIVSTWRIPAKTFREADENVEYQSEERANPYGRIPFVKLELPRALWLMDQMSSLVKELLNKHSALSWAEFRALFPQLVAYLKRDSVNVDGGREPGSADDAARIFAQPKGPGYAWALYVDESMEYVGPDTSAFEYCAQAIDARKTELARVLYALNLAADLSSGSQRRTAESKSLDIAVSKPFLSFLGRTAREHTRQVLELVAHLRGDAVEFEVGGFEHVQALDIGQLVEQAVGVSALEIPSRTFRRAFDARVAKAVLGHDATPEIVTDIDAELEEHYAHDLDMTPPMVEPAIEDDDADELDGDGDDSGS